MEFEEFDTEMLNKGKRTAENISSDYHNILTHFRNQYEQRTYEIITSEILGMSENMLYDLIEGTLIDGINSHVIRAANTIPDEIIYKTQQFIRESQTSKKYLEKYKEEINEIVFDNKLQRLLEEELEEGIQTIIRKINNYFQDLSYLDAARYEYAITEIKMNINKQTKLFLEVLIGEINETKRKNLQRLLETAELLLSELNINSLTEDALSQYRSIIENSNYEIIFSNNGKIHLMDTTNGEIYTPEFEGDTLKATLITDNIKNISFEKTANGLKYTKNIISSGDILYSNGNKQVITTTDTLLMKPEGIGITSKEGYLTFDEEMEKEEKYVVQFKDGEVTIKGTDRNEKETIELISQKYPKLYETLLEDKKIAEQTQLHSQRDK